jgi:hypothetical protein
MADDYDTPWKDALTRYFPEFLSFYFPAAHAAIDWLRPHAFLNAELAALAHDGGLGRRIADKLVQVHTLAGGEQWVLVHIEVQAQRDRALAERVFTYNYRTFDRYRRQVASLVVLADRHPHWRPAHFGYELLGSCMSFNFSVSKLLDFARQDLSCEPNPFALVTMAHLQTAQTSGDPAARFAAKWRLTRLLYERHWNKQRVVDLYKVVDWLMRLPPELEHELQERIGRLEKERGMAWISSAERIGMEKGLKQGLKEGLEKGLEKGREEGREEGRRHAARDFLTTQLVGRFGTLDPASSARLAAASTEQLFTWAQAFVAAGSLEDVFR